MNMNKQYIKEVALECGFKLKEQPNGDLDLNPYVYTFAEELIKQTHISLLGDFKSMLANINSLLGDFKDMLADINSEINDAMLECE